MPGPDDEDRDEHGRWTSGGDSSGGEKESDNLMSTMSDVTGIKRETTSNGPSQANVMNKQTITKDKQWLIKLETVRGMYRVSTNYIGKGSSGMYCDHNQYFKTQKEALADYKAEKGAAV